MLIRVIIQLIKFWISIILAQLFHILVSLGYLNQFLVIILNATSNLRGLILAGGTFPMGGLWILIQSVVMPLRFIVAMA